MDTRRGNNGVEGLTCMTVLTAGGNKPLGYGCRAESRDWSARSFLEQSAQIAKVFSEDGEVMNTNSFAFRLNETQFPTSRLQGQIHT
jgi:hypothetical protein